MFTFFAGGALGGWLVLVAFVIDKMEGWRRW
jgi:hypothetical protein